MSIWAILTTHLIIIMGSLPQFWAIFLLILFFYFFSSLILALMFLFFILSICLSSKSFLYFNRNFDMSTSLDRFFQGFFLRIFVTLDLIRAWDFISCWPCINFSEGYNTKHYIDGHNIDKNVPRNKHLLWCFDVMIQKKLNMILDSVTKEKIYAVFTY